MRLTYKAQDQWGKETGTIWYASQDGDSIFPKSAKEEQVLKKLAAYEDAEEQGLLVRLPYKVGDMFWAIAYSEPRVIHVRLYQITVHYEYGYIIWVENIDNEMDWWKVSLKDFDKWSHFNSHEEAEAVMMKMEET